MNAQKFNDSWSKTSPRRLDHAVSLLTCFNSDNKPEVVEAGVDSKEVDIISSLSEKNENSYKNTGLKNL